MRRERAPGLTDLAFEGRNKEYGAFYIRKKYKRYLLVSVLCGLFVLLVVVFIPFFYYLFEPVPLIDGDFMYEVEYYSMSAPPDDEMNKLIQSFARPVPETNQIPVVSDSVVPEEKPREEVEEEKQEPENAKVDSMAMKGGSGMGTGIGEDTGIASNFDVYPRFPGGDEARLYFLRKFIRYPEDALKKKIQGVVMVVFIVELDGSLSRVDVVNRLGGGCDEEAIRVTQTMPRWEPGKRNGKAVRVMVRMPIVFRIPGQGKPG